eukprot:3134040-Rhodomonas_salina.1
MRGSYALTGTYNALVKVHRHVTKKGPLAREHLPATCRLSLTTGQRSACLFTNFSLPGAKHPSSFLS